MSTHSALPSRWDAGLPGHQAQLASYAGVGAAAVSALLYFLMGTVGPFRLTFSLVMGAVFAVAAVLLAWFAQLRVWVPIAVLDLGAIVGYFAVAPSRDPHFEIWGLAIKASQVVLLAALGYLITRAWQAQRGR